MLALCPPCPQLLPELARTPEGSPLRSHLPVLQVALEETLAALEARAKVRGERSLVAHEVEDWKEGVRRLRTTTYAELLKLGAARGLGKGWADTFFRKHSERRAGEEPEAVESTEAGGGEG